MIINKYNWMEKGCHDILRIRKYTVWERKKMNMKKEKTMIIIAGLIIGVIASLLVFFGNPANMGFCIACFLRDTSGALGLHSAGAVQYIRPEIIGLVLGSFLLAVFRKEFAPRGGSSPMTRFMLGFFVMIGCLMFLGCPFRMILRLAGGDLNAIFGLVGFAAGILCGVFFLNRGYSLKRTYKLPKAEGILFPAVQAVFLALLAAAPAFIRFSDKFMFGYCVYTCFFEPEQTGVETDNAGEIHRAGFKSIRHKIRNFFLMADASGTAGKKRFDQRNHIRFQYKSSNALRAEKPFVTGEGESIDMHGFHVDWPYSAGLSRVYKKF